MRPVVTPGGQTTRPRGRRPVPTAGRAAPRAARGDAAPPGTRPRRGDRPPARPRGRRRLSLRPRPGLRSGPTPSGSPRARLRRHAPGAASPPIHPGSTPRSPIRRGDLEERTWLAFQIAYLGPPDGDDPFDASTRRAPPGPPASRRVSTTSTPARATRRPARGTRTIDAYRAWAQRSGSQAAAFCGDASWTPERRFDRVFERLALPGMDRGARFDLLVTLGRSASMSCAPAGCTSAGRPGDARRQTDPRHRRPAAAGAPRRRPGRSLRAADRGARPRLLQLAARDADSAACRRHRARSRLRPRARRARSSRLDSDAASCTSLWPDALPPAGPLAARRTVRGDRGRRRDRGAAHGGAADRRLAGGPWLLRAEGRAAWRRLSAAVADGRAPGREAVDGALALVAGLLFIVPGFITDVIGSPAARAVRAPVAGVSCATSAAGLSAPRSSRGARRSATTSTRPRATSTRPSCTDERRGPRVRRLRSAPPTGRLWGAASRRRPRGALVLGAGTRRALAGWALRGRSTARGWRADRRRRRACSVEPRGEDPSTPAAADAPGQRRGRSSAASPDVTIRGREHTVDCAGARMSSGPDAGALPRARACRPVPRRRRRSRWSRCGRGTEHQDGDVVAAALFDPDGWVAVADPRLSTTYTARRAHADEPRAVGRRGRERVPAPRRRRGRGPGAASRRRLSLRVARCSATAVATTARACTCSPPSAVVSAVSARRGGDQRLRRRADHAAAGLIRGVPGALRRLAGGRSGRRWRRSRPARGANPLFELETGRSPRPSSWSRSPRSSRAQLGRESRWTASASATSPTSSPTSVIAFMRELRARGCKLAICTNNVREWEQRWRAMLPVDEIFDVVVDSADVGARKPEPRIYELTLERLGVAAGAALLIDDIEINCDAARALGLSAVWFQTTEQAIADDEAALAAARPMAPEHAGGRGGRRAAGGGRRSRPASASGRWRRVAGGGARRRAADWAGAPRPEPTAARAGSRSPSPAGGPARPCRRRAPGRSRARRLPRALVRVPGGPGLHRRRSSGDQPGARFS